jgi:hypothetical protein
MNRLRKKSGNNPIYNNLKKVKYFKINLMKESKDLLNENYKPLKREIEEHIRNWKELPCSWIDRIN